jgi:hypothetical protein
VTRLAFADTETTGLDPDHHEVWDVGLILRDESGSEEEFEWRLPVDLSRADAFALGIGRFHERHRQGHEWGYGSDCPPPSTGLPEFAAKFAKLTRGAHLVGAVISFDEERLRKILKVNGALPEWHYHLVDVEALAAGYLAGHEACRRQQELVPFAHDAEPPWKSVVLAETLGLDMKTYEVHTALGDARWARDLYDAVMRGPTVT